MLEIGAAGTMTRTEKIRAQQLCRTEYRKRESDERCGCDSERHEQRDAMESDAVINGSIHKPPIREIFLCRNR